MNRLIALIALALVGSACATATLPLLPTPTRGAAGEEVVPTVAPTQIATRAPSVAMTAPAPLASGTRQSSVPPNSALASIPVCPTDINTPLFNTIPIDPADFLAFRPLGFLSPPIHMFPAKHSAFSMTLPGQRPVAKPVKSPSKAWVVEIWEASFSTGNANYQVYVYPCREVRIYFGHVATLSEKLLAEFRKGGPKCNSFQEGTSTVTTCRRENLAIPLEAGEQFGSGPDSAGVDMGVEDNRLPPAGFIRIEHYSHNYPFFASPLDYFAPEMKKVLAGKTGNVFGNKMRTAEPVGGTYMQDIAGNAQGNWFLPGKYHSNTTDLSPFLGLARNYVDPAQPMIAMGNSVKGANMGLLSFAPQASGKINRDFGAVKADGAVYCYDNFLQGQSAGGLPLGRLNGILLMTMPNDTTLKLELQRGAKCDANAAHALTANATTFER